MNSSTFSKAEFVEKYMEVLQPLEHLVAYFYRHNPKIHDHDVLRIYEALLKYAKAKLNNYPLPQPKLEGISSQLYLQQLVILVSVESLFSYQEIQESLKTLVKSVWMWNKNLGSQGYLNFIFQFN